ncbi:MAG: hypothetical protein HQL31_11010, partial [Planctomycetes bacterium]|nr:hypothetical protein [Planctomycetota bacterium]
YFIELTFAPPGNPVKVEELLLKLPLRGDSETMLAFGAGGKTSGFLSKEKGRIWKSSDRQAKIMTVGTFVPVIWVGDDRNGLFWVADNDKGWVPSDEHEASELYREEDDSLTLVHNLIKDPNGFTIDKSRTISFWIMPTPVVPYQSDWRQASKNPGGCSGCFSRGGSFEQSHRMDPETKINGWMWYHPETTNPDPATWEKYYRKMRYSNDWEQKKICFASTWGVQSGMKKEIAYFRSEWGEGEYTPSLIDHYIWLFDKYVRDGDLDYIYEDVMNIDAYKTLSSETAYYLPDGRIQPGFVITARREHNKRLYAVFVEAGKRPWIGGNNIALLPVTSFMTMYLTGDDNISAGSKYDFGDLRTPGFLRSRVIPEIMGGVQRPFFTYGKGNWRTIRGHLALHNIFGDSTSNSFMTIMGIENIYTRGDLSKFHAYWRNQEYVKVNVAGMKEDEIKCSILQQTADDPDGTDLHIFVFNYNKEKEAHGVVTIDLKKMIRGATELKHMEDISIPNAKWGPGSPARAVKEYVPQFKFSPRLDAAKGLLVIDDLSIPKRDFAEIHLRVK